MLIIDASDKETKINKESYIRLTGCFNEITFQGREIECHYFVAVDLRELTNVKLPANIFSSMERIRRIFLPKNLEKIQTGTFKSLSKLRLVRIPSSVTVIEKGAFDDCPNLKEPVVIPNNIISLDKNAFINCYETTIVISPKNKEASKTFNGIRYKMIENVIERYGFSYLYNDYTELMISTENNDLDTVRTKILEFPNDKGHETFSLEIAAYHGYIDMVRELVTYQANWKTQDGLYTAIMSAAQNNNLECVKILKKFEAGKIISGNTALGTAVAHEHIEIIRELIDVETKLIDPRNNESDYETALMKAVQIGNSEIIDLLIPYEAGISTRRGITGLIIATEINDYETCRKLIDYEANKSDQFGNTALMYACARKDDTEAKSKIIKTLVEYEAGIRNSIGLTALMIAVQSEAIDAVKILKDYECKIKDFEGRSALCYAFERELYEIVDLLFEYEKDIDEVKCFIKNKDVFIKYYGIDDKNLFQFEKTWIF